MQMKSCAISKVVASLLTFGVLAAACGQHTQSEAAMAPDLHPGFAVATIKPSDPASTREGFPTEGHHIACYGETLATILTVAYSVHAKQIVDAPEWVYKDRFDIEGVPDQPGIPSLPQMQEMYRKLLAERFHLVLRREQRPIPFYAVTVARGTPQLKPAQPGEHLNTANMTHDGVRTLRFTNMPMPAFALNLNFYEDRPVIDKTGLTGSYDFTLTWTYDMNREGEPGAPPSIFTAMREQLGLKVDAVKGPTDVLVVESIGRPSPN